MSNSVRVDEIELREALQEAVRRNVPLSFLHQLCDLAQWPYPTMVDGVLRFYWEPESETS